MRAASNSGRPFGGNGLLFLQPRGMVFRVEQRHWEPGKGAQWVKVSVDHGIHELANQEADKLRAQGFTVRVRPLVL